MTYLYINVYYCIYTYVRRCTFVGSGAHTLVAEYLSWEHQDQSKMQRRYTNLVASRLIPVADMIEKIYGFGKVVEKEIKLAYNQ